MESSSRTPEGRPNWCPICDQEVRIDPSRPSGDAPCPRCGGLLWFESARSIESVDFMVQDAIARNLEAETKEVAVASLVRCLQRVGCVPREAVDDVVEAVMQREQLGPTGLGGGFALPHAKHAGVSRLMGTIGYARRGVDFDSPDGRLVHTIVLLLSPPDRDADYLRALERISRLVSTESL